MKRFHVHLHVESLDKSIGFYSQLFGAEPSRVESDYAKWMIEDPPVNFAISTRGGRPGIDHLGIQSDDPADLAEMKQRAQAADMALLDEGETTCCYARSEKHWVTDPQGSPGKRSTRSRASRCSTNAKRLIRRRRRRSAARPPLRETTTSPLR